MSTIFERELRMFGIAGRKAGFVAPYSMVEGDYQGKHIVVEGKPSIDLTRLDYLALGQNEQVRDIMHKCINSFDTACPGSQMVIRTAQSVGLEEAMSELYGMQDTILFLNGYVANENVIQALAFRMRIPHLIPYIRIAGLSESSDISTGFFVDDEAHFSLIHSIKSAKAILRDHCNLQRYRAADYDHLTQQLEKSLEKYGDRMIRIIVTDTIASMSGKVYDVKKLCEIAEEFDCLLYLDEAHAIGAFGEEGAGVASEFPDFDRYRNRLLIMGTFTKAFAQMGAYVTMPSSDLGDFLRSASPEYIFSAPIPPWQADVNKQVLGMIRGDYGKEERRKLREISVYTRAKLLEYGFNTMGTNSQIMPLFIGEEEKSFKVKGYLQEKGFLSALCECPVVPKGESILRFSICSDITFDDASLLVECIRKARDKFKF